MKREIDLNGGDKDASLLHFDGEPMVVMAEHLANEIIAKAREMNPGKDGLICGGCINGMIIALLLVLNERGHGNRHDFITTLEFMAQEMWDEARRLRRFR